MPLDAPDRCPLAFYFLRVTTAAIAALQSSPKLVRASLMQATFWMRRRSVLHCPPHRTGDFRLTPGATYKQNLASPPHPNSFGFPAGAGQFHRNLKI
jgi:hypothetical protein